MVNLCPRGRKHLVVGCTVSPGFNAAVGRPLLEQAGCAAWTLSYSPALVAQGRILHGLRSPDVVLVGADDDEAAARVAALHQSIVQPVACGDETRPSSGRVMLMSVASAEIAKLALNCFITTKIAFANAVADVADATSGADKHAILRAIGADCRVGERCLAPGYVPPCMIHGSHVESTPFATNCIRYGRRYGFGGPCFPRDNRAFGQYAASVGTPCVLCSATDAANEHHARVMAATRLAEGTAAGTSVYVFDDVAYRPGCDIDIIEESQALEVRGACNCRALSTYFVRIVHAPCTAIGNTSQNDAPVTFPSLGRVKTRRAAAARACP